MGRWLSATAPFPHASEGTGSCRVLERERLDCGSKPLTARGVVLEDFTIGAVPQDLTHQEREHGVVGSGPRREVAPRETRRLGTTRIDDPHVRVCAQHPRRSHGIRHGDGVAVRHDRVGPEPSPRGCRSTSHRHGRPQRASAPSSACRSADSNSRASVVKAAKRALLPFLETKAVILEGTPAAYAPADRHAIGASHTLCCSVGERCRIALPRGGTRCERLSWARRAGSGAASGSGSRNGAPASRSSPGGASDSTTRPRMPAPGRWPSRAMSPTRGRADRRSPRRRRDSVASTRWCTQPASAPSAPRRHRRRHVAPVRHQRHGAALVTSAASGSSPRRERHAVYSSVKARRSRRRGRDSACAVNKAALTNSRSVARRAPRRRFPPVVVGDCGGEGDSMTGLRTDGIGSSRPSSISSGSRKYLSGPLIDVEHLVTVVDAVLRSGASMSIPSVTVAPGRPGTATRTEVRNRDRHRTVGRVDGRGRPARQGRADRASVRFRWVAERDLRDPARRAALRDAHPAADRTGLARRGHRARVAHHRGARRHRRAAHRGGRGVHRSLGAGPHVLPDGLRRRLVADGPHRRLAGAVRHRPRGSQGARVPARRGHRAALEGRLAGEGAARPRPARRLPRAPGRPLDRRSSSASRAASCRVSTLPRRGCAPTGRSTSSPASCTATTSSPT